MRFSRATLVALAICSASPSFGRSASQVEQASVAPTLRVMRHDKGDPLEGFNRRMFALNQRFDRAIFRPLARGYDAILPKPVHHGLRNFLRNLTEPIVFLNDLLQLKPKRAAHTLVRFAVNSTFGLGGILDVAVKADLPHRNNGFGNTLGHYGVGPGPYVFLPFVGPSDLRDFGAGQIDRAVLPLSVGKPFNRIWWIVPTGVVSGLEQRNAADEDLRNLLSGAADPYATLRSVYLQSRQAEIAEIDGRKKGPDIFDDPLKDPGAPSPQSSPTPEGPKATAPDVDTPAAAPSAADKPAVTVDPASPATATPRADTPAPTAPLAADTIESALPAIY